MAVEFISPLVIVGGAVVFIALERAFPYDRGQPVFREGFWTDLVWYTFIQSYVLALLISGIIRWIDGHSSLSALHLVSGWPLVAQFALFFITHDLYIYLFHRLQHRSRLLWRIHEAHHSVDDVDWLAGSRSHALEILINQTIEFLPMALLGADPRMPVIKGMVDAVWGMYIHSNINVHSGFLQYVINGPEMHRWHHSRKVVGDGVNFSTKLAIWDWLFGTAHRPREKPPGYGLEYVQFPRGYLSQFVFAFRRFETD